MERGFQMGGRGGVIDVSYLKPRAKRNVLETFPQLGEPRGSSPVQRRESRNIGRGRMCSIRWMEDNGIRRGVPIDHIDATLRGRGPESRPKGIISSGRGGEERMFHRLVPIRTSSNNPLVMWRGLDGSRRATKLIHDILYYYVQRKIKEHDDSNSCRAVHCVGRGGR